MLHQLKIDLVSRFYPLSIDEVKTNIDRLNFDGYHFMMSEHIEWDIELVDLLKDKIDWTALFKLKSLKVDIPFINLFIDYIDFKTVGICNVVFSNQIHKGFLDRYPWGSDNILLFLNKNEEMIPYVLAEYKEVINWKVFSRSIALPYITIVQYENYIDWDELSKNNKINDVDLVLLHYRVRLDERSISGNIAYADLIRKNPQALTWKWNSVLLNHGFSLEKDAEFLYKNYRENLKLANNESLKKKFINICLLRMDKSFLLRSNKSLKYINWNNPERINGAILSKELIEEHKETLDFKNSSFLRANKDIIDGDFIRANISLFDVSNHWFAYLNFDIEFVEEYEDQINWCILSFNEFLHWNEDFIIKNSDRLDFLKLSWNKSVYLGLGLDKKGVGVFK